MSRRFGRNQKRKMREALAGVEAGLALTAKKLESTKYSLLRLERELSDVRAQLDAVRHTIGKNFVGLPPEERESTMLDLEGVVRAWIDPRAHFDLANMYAPAEHQVAQSVVLQMLLDKPKFVDKLRGQIHLSFTFDGLPIGYGITQHALQNAGPEYLEQVIGRQVAHMILRDRRI